MRRSVSFDVNADGKIYIMCIHPIFEYGLNIWSPQHKNSFWLLENVQRQDYTKFITGNASIYI